MGFKLISNNFKLTTITKNSKLLAFVFTFLLLVISYKLLVTHVRAQDAPVPKPLVPCSETRYPEFHSLRPYQASPCNPDFPPTAKFCGNELTFHDTIEEKYPGGGTCVDDGTKVTCTYKEKKSKNLIIDLSVANLPIMGNTEDVPNSQPPTSTESLSDADKMNGYVSWYLNGVMGRAEDGNSKNNTTSVVNFSGPINKLLPQTIQEAERVKTVKSGFLGIGNRHDQTVVCAYGSKAVNCYPPPIASTYYKLSSWVGKLSWWNSWTNGIAGVINFLANLFPFIPRDVIEDSVGNHWNYRLPPLPWDDGKGKPFASDVLYQKAYAEWHGKTCILLPIVNRIICVDNNFVPNEYAELFPYIPLSSTEDLKGSVEVDKVSSATNPSVDGVDLSDVSFDKQTPSTLFFSHMQESTELADTLQNTFVGKSERGNKKGAPTNVSPPASCTTVDVRSNKGDKLFATDLTGTLNYTAEFSCQFDAVSTCSGSCNLPNERECRNAGGKAGTGSCANGRFCCNLPGSTPPPPTQQTCTKDVYISLSTTSSTPKVEDIWSQLVAGPQSIFKRIFPKTNTPGSVGLIKDIPGSTSINYQLEGLSQQTTDLKFPHIGGISEYFLKGIQTALRPKGYGEPISFDSSTTNTPISCSGGSLPTLPGASGYCKFKNLGTIGSANLSNLPTLVGIIEAAAQSYNVPPGILLGIMYGEGAFNPGRYDWTEANVKAWGCSSMPNCSPTSFPSTGVVPFFEPYWNSLKTAVNIVDPARTPNPCNLMDAIFALAKDSSQNRTGSSDFSGKTCYGIFLNSGSSNSAGCMWYTTDYETAIRVWDFGVTFDNTYTCATNKGSCATGGMSAVCPGGDLCETIGGSGNTSHNACVWDVAVSH